MYNVTQKTVPRQIITLDIRIKGLIMKGVPCYVAIKHVQKIHKFIIVSYYVHVNFFEAFIMIRI